MIHAPRNALKSVPFKLALQHFCNVIDGRSETANLFYKGYLQNRKEHASEIPLCIDTGLGTCSAEDVQPWYIADAIKLYERRRDQHQDETALLFDKQCPHMILLTQMIRDMKRFSKPESAEMKATLEIETALNQVLKNRTPLLKEIEAPPIPLQILGYHSGIVARREYDKLSDGTVRPTANLTYEIGTESLANHLLEQNALCGLEAPTIDIAAIPRIGAVTRFNFKHTEDGRGIFLTNIENITDLPTSLKDPLAPSTQKHWSKNNSDPLSFEDLTGVERKLAHLATKYPAQIKGYYSAEHHVNSVGR